MRSARDQAVEMCHRNADGNAIAQSAQHATSCRPVNVERFAFAPVIGGDHVRLSFDVKPDVADDAAVKNLMDSFLIVFAAFGQPLNLGAFGGEYSLIASF